MIFSQEGKNIKNDLKCLKMICIFTLKYIFLIGSDNFNEFNWTNDMKSKTKKETKEKQNKQVKIDIYKNAKKRVTWVVSCTWSKEFVEFVCVCVCT